MFPKTEETIGAEEDDGGSGTQTGNELPSAGDETKGKEVEPQNSANKARGKLRLEPQIYDLNKNCMIMLIILIIMIMIVTDNYNHYDHTLFRI